MNNKINRIQNAATYLLLIIAISILALVIRNEFIVSKHSSAQEGGTLRTLDLWQELVLKPTNFDEKSDIYIIEFIDYSCPYCKVLNESIDEVIDKHSELTFHKTKYYLPSGNKDSISWNTTRLAICADEGNEFANLHRELFRIAQNGTMQDLKKTKTDFELNKKVEECMFSEETEEAILIAQSLAQEKKIEFVPTVVINGLIIEGAAPVHVLDKVLEKVVKNNIAN